MTPIDPAILAADRFCIGTDDRVEVFKAEHGWPHPYPWGFRVWFGGKCYHFAGIPNQCETRTMAGYEPPAWAGYDTEAAAIDALSAALIAEATAGE